MLSSGAEGSGSSLQPAHSMCLQSAQLCSALGSPPQPLCAFIHSLFLSFLPSHTQSILRWTARGILVKPRSVPAPQPSTIAPSSLTVRDGALPITLMVLTICPIISMPSSLPGVTRQIPGTLLPQGLCTSDAFCLAHSSLGHLCCSLTIKSLHGFISWAPPPDQPVCICINPFP